MLALPAADDPLRQGHGIQQGVIPVENGDAIVLQVLKNLTFCL